MQKKHLILLITLSLFILIGTVVNVLLYKHWDKEPIEAKNTLALKVKDQETNKDLKSIIHEAQKNVVQIEASSELSTKTGSGFLYNNKGDIITNAHVVKNADFITVKMANAQTYTAALVGIGEETDIALIRVPQLHNLSPALLDKNYFAEIGNEIIAVGSPLGFQNSVTLGIISGTNRSFTIDEYNYNDVYQISANITHGNSGGPLIDRSSGKVVAINSAGSEEGGLGFSIPINAIIDQVMQWSENAKEEELVYNNPLNQKIDPEQLATDGEYIIQYFFDSLAIRDYINAYALLGSDWQTEKNYKQFREDYIHVVQIDSRDMTSKYEEDRDLLKITVTVDMKIRKSDEQEISEKWKYTFYIGNENDQLKIIDSNKELSNTNE